MVLSFLKSAFYPREFKEKKQLTKDHKPLAALI